MAFWNEIGDVLDKYAGGPSGDAATQQEAHGDYDRIASAVPGPVLGSVIGPALSTLGAGAIRDRVTASASHMTPDTRGQFLQTLLGAASRVGGGSGSLLSQLGISPSVAANPQQASPADVGTVAAAVHQNHPEAFNEAMSFYKEHPTLVKALGTIAIARIAQQLSAHAAQHAR